MYTLAILENVSHFTHSTLKFEHIVVNWNWYRKFHTQKPHDIVDSIHWYHPHHSIPPTSNSRPMQRRAVVTECCFQENERFYFWLRLFREREIDRESVWDVRRDTEMLWLKGFSYISGGFVCSCETRREGRVGLGPGDVGPDFLRGETQGSLVRRIRLKADRPFHPGTTIEHIRVIPFVGSHLPPSPSPSNSLTAPSEITISVSIIEIRVNTTWRASQETLEWNTNQNTIPTVHLTRTKMTAVIVSQIFPFCCFLWL